MNTSIHSNIDFNNPKEVQKELEKLLRERFGKKINILTHTSSNEDDDPDDESSSSEPSPKSNSEDEDSSLDHILSFDATPKQLKAHLDKYVIAQDEAKKTLAIAICNHYNQIKHYHSLSEEEKLDYEYSKQNILLIGPTGVGKTYMVRQIAKLVGVPFVKADATKYSETGYMGGNVEDLIKDLVSQAGDDLQAAEHGIIYIDEADKLATSISSTHHSKDISGRGVQLGLLKMLEDGEVDLRSGHDPASQMQALMDMQSSGGRIRKKVVSTKHILFILSGAFSNLEDIISKRISTPTIGFTGTSSHSGSASTGSASTTATLAQVRTEDLIEYGFEPEFIGRLPVRVACHELSIDHLYQILKTAHGSIINQFSQSFKAYNIEATFHDCALHTIAREAHKEGTGARSLVTILDKALKNFLFELPSSTLRSLGVTKELIEDPESTLRTMLDHEKLFSQPLGEAVREYERSFAARHLLNLTINPDAYAYIYEAVNHVPSDIPQFLHDRLQVFEYAIKIIAQNEGRDTISISRTCLENPSETFENWIKNSFAPASPLSASPPSHTPSS